MARKVRISVYGKCRSSEMVCGPREGMKMLRGKLSSIQERFLRFLRVSCKPASRKGTQW